MGENGRFVERRYFAESADGGRADLYHLFSDNPTGVEREGFKILNGRGENWSDIYVQHVHGACLIVGENLRDEVRVNSAYDSGQTNLIVSLQSSFGIQLIDQESPRARKEILE